MAPITDAPAQGIPQPFRPMRTPRQLRVPLWTGPDDKPGVKPPGTTVARGEALTEHGHYGSAAALAPTAGRIAGVQPTSLLDGRSVLCVILDTIEAAATIESSASRTIDLRAALHPIHGSALGLWIDRLRQAGVHAERWSSPDLIAQLNQCLSRPVDTLICNALDVDPTLPLQATLANQHLRDIMAGAALLARLAGATSVWIIIDEAAAAQLDPAVLAQGEAVGVRLVPVQNEYPRAHPTILLHALTGRRLPFGQLPTSHGVLLLDADAAGSVGRCFLHDQPTLAAPLAVYVNEAAHFLLCPVGASVADVLSEIGLPIDRFVIRSSSPLRDVRIGPDAIVGGSELTLFLTEEEPDINPDPCIRCAWCVEGCPVRIQPAALLEASQRDDPAMAERYGLHACIECGICNYVCPSQLPLLQGIRTLRAREQGNLPKT